MERGLHRYLFVNVSVSWNMANMYCRSYGFTLTVIDDATENEWITQQALKFGLGIYAHIGLNDRAQRGQWVWEDGSPSGYKNWDTQYNNGLSPQPDMRPGENCALLGVTGSSLPGRWHDNFCGADGVLTSLICEHK